MKIVVATGKGGLDDQVAPTFGRAASFTLIEVDGNKIAKVEVVPNQFAGAPGGAGIQAAQGVANAGAKAVIAGNYGPNAAGVLSQAGVEMLTLSGLTVREAVERYIKGELAPSGAGAMATPGFGPGMGMGGGGMGRRMGRGGMGRRMGRGGGMCVGRGMWGQGMMSPSQAPYLGPQTPMPPAAGMTPGVPGARAEDTERSG